MENISTFLFFDYFCLSIADHRSFKSAVPSEFYVVAKIEIVLSTNWIPRKSFKKVGNWSNLKTAASLLAKPLPNSFLLSDTYSDKRKRFLTLLLCFDFKGLYSSLFETSQKMQPKTIIVKPRTIELNKKTERSLTEAST